MAWTQRNAEIRLVHTGWAGDRARVMKPWRPFELRNDACARSSERWEVTTTPDGPTTTYAWWQVITSDDNARARYAKFNHARKVRAAQDKLREAERELRWLTT